MSKTEKLDRRDPKKNKSEAIRQVLKKHPLAKASDVVDKVKEQFGHTVPQSSVYMAKTRRNIKKRARRNPSRNSTSPSAVQFAAIRTGKQLLTECGSLSNAVDLLKAIAG